MSSKAFWPNRKGLRKVIHGYIFYLGTAWDIAHGFGWHCQVITKKHYVGYGFDKKNKFKAVRMAIREIDTDV